jgi:hypothetical protein
MVAHTYNSSIWEAEARGSQAKASKTMSRKKEEKKEQKEERKKRKEGRKEGREEGKGKYQMCKKKSNV